LAQVYPSPTLVLGLGRFGLALLERLGDDWMGLKRSGVDASLANLGLVSVHGGSGCSEAWRRQESRGLILAQEVGEGDLPSLALEFAVLRTLGLIRYRDGVFQVAVPRDAGVTEMLVPGGGEGRGTRVRRRRYFEWWSLSPDPIAAVERLQRLAERHNDLELFIAPILNRVRQGHSPRLLLAVIGRCHALAEGRDPSPWPWIRAKVARDGGAGHAEQEAGARRLRLDPGADWLPGERSAGADLEGVAPGPLPGWPGRAGEQESELAMVLPPWFVPRETDVVTPFDPLDLLAVDWEATGWASETDQRVRFESVTASPFRLGLFDHDSHSRERRLEELLAPRFQRLAEHVYRGLLRLWVDLQRERVEELDPNLEHRLRQEDLDTALRQSLEILGMLLVRPLVAQDRTAEGTQAEGNGELPGEPSPFLTGLVLGTEEEGEGGALEERLDTLGVAPTGPADAGRVPLLRRVELRPRAGEGGGGAREGAGRPEGLLALRRVLNEEVRRRYSFSFLTGIRDVPTRRPPRLTVYVVGDMAEAFTRASMREVLREIHAELLRSFSPIFEVYQEGFNRCLSVVPILWMPHPADPFVGGQPAESRGEEAAIIDAVHGVRRWVESVLPASRRHVPQIFINSRVTDNAVLSSREAIRQTRDFLSFQTRNDVSRDEWLRRIATGPGGDDLFSSFACAEIDFPAERCREYLANLLARACLTELKRGRIVSSSTSTLEKVTPPSVQAGKKAITELAHWTAEVAGRLEGVVSGRISVQRETPAQMLAAAFDDGFERDLVRRIQEAWSELTQRQGRVDEKVAELRREISSHLPAAVGRVREHDDRLVAEQAGRGGLPTVRAGFEGLQEAARGELQRREEERRRWEDLSRRHRVPDLGPVRSARAAVAAAAARKPDLLPMWLGGTLAALLALVLGAPLVQAAAGLLGGPLALLLGRFDGLIGSALLTTVTAFLLRSHMDRCVGAVVLAITGLAQRSRELIHGRGEPPEREESPSVRSFLETRLHLSEALAMRGYALRVLERTMGDFRLLHRLARSVDIQLQRLVQSAEDLGVRPLGRESDCAIPQDDLRNLFAAAADEATEPLIDPESLKDYFARRIGGDEDLGPWIGDLIRASGGLEEWRKNACLADRQRILAFGRRTFEDVVGTPIAEQDVFADEAGERLCRFVASRYPNLGFGAKFLGYEGLDPDGVHLKALAALVLSPGLHKVYEQARFRQSAAATTDSMAVIEAQVRPNTAYMLSLVQGIRAHSVRNLRRFESFHDRLHTPDDRTFPLAQEEQRSGEPGTINYLSGYTDLGEKLRAGVGRVSVPEGGLDG
jgi:hypothetical protein